MSTLSFIRQRDSMDCGPTCLAMVCKYYRKNIPIQTLRDKTEIGKEGVSLLGISNAAERIGFRAQGVQLTYAQLTKEAPLPCILHWGQNHFVVLYEANNNTLKIADPGRGLIKSDKTNFLKQWASATINNEPCGIALLLIIIKQIL